MVIHSHSESETKKIAADFAEKVKDGGVVFLYGELGAGKTTFVQGVAEALGIKQRILSPTFTIFRQYPISDDHTLYHIDLYRMLDETSLDTLGLEDVFENKKNIVFIEWPQHLANDISDFSISIKRVSEAERQFTMHSRY